MSWVETSGLVPDDASADDQFGQSVSIYGDTAIIGAPLRDASGSNSGKAYIYRLTNGTWNLEQPLIAPDASGGDIFGGTVAIYGDTAIVGAPSNDASGTNSGKVYIYTRSGSTWSLQQGLTAPDPSANDGFGSSLAIYEDTIIVGTPQKDASGANSGKVYIYKRTLGSWNLEQAIISPDASILDFFGISVAIYGDTAIFGALFEDASGTDSGKVYIYKRTLGFWNLEQPLIAPDASGGDIFGGTVAIYGDTAIVGAPSKDVSGIIDSGKVYIYKRTLGFWNLEQPLIAPDASGGDSFGQKVAIYGDRVIIGAPPKDVSGIIDAGKVYIYKRILGLWNLEQQLVESSSTEEDRFGSSVSIYDNTLIVGSPFIDASGANSGKAYIYTFEQLEPSGQLTLAEQNDICICSETLCANLSYTGVTESSKVTNIKDDKTIAISFNRQQEVNAVRNRSFASFDDYLRYKQASLKNY